MLLQSFKRIIKSDFADDEQDMIEKLSYSINQGFDNVLNTLNNNVSLANNVACTLRDFQVAVDSTGTPKKAVVMKLLNSQVKAIGSTVITSNNITNARRVPTSQPFITFSQNNDTIIISNISGLQVDDNYVLKVIIWHG